LALGLIDWGVVARHVAQRWQATHPQVQWSLPEAPVPVMADAAALQALTEAVLHNAVKFSARQAQPVVRLSAQPLDDGWWRLQVQDQGVGFDRQRAQHLGELFQRMHRDAEFPGVGCGLALVQTVAQRHGARLAIEAQPQAGCTVCIDWPGAL
jgi:light-regulated signal transduction histidine kinase (bacteriophytochrome)